GEVFEQLENAPLFRARAVVDLRAIDLAGEVEQDADFVLQRSDELGLGHHHWGLTRKVHSAKYKVQSEGGRISRGAGPPKPRRGGSRSAGARTELSAPT